MFVIGNFFIAIARVLDILLNITMWILVAQAVISWVSPDPYNPIVRFLYSATEPILRPIRRRMPMHTMGMDFSTIVAILIIIFLQSFLVNTLFTFGQQMR